MGVVSFSLLPSKVHETLIRLGMVLPGERILVGLSGGADSVALTETLFELSRRFDPPLSLVLAHLNHLLRDEADDDEAFCRSVAGRLSLPFVSERIDVGALAARAKRSIEDQGRRARYGFLAHQAQRWACQRVAVGHTLDDQAETLLLRLLRGSGGRGLGSVHPVVGSCLIRPLIEIRRHELVGYLESRGIPYRDDLSNADPRFTRNRLRHRILPELEREFNPRLVETLAKSASLFRDEEDWMERETGRVFEGLAVRRAGTVQLDIEALSRLHPALQRRLVRRAIETVRGDLSNVGQVHVEDVLALTARGKSGREVHLPGLRADRSFGELRIRTSPGTGRQNGPERGYNGFEYRLSIPARIRVPEGGGVLSVGLYPERRWKSGAVSRRPAVGNAVVAAVEEGSRELQELTVRSPRPGDRFHPLGAPGSKPLMRYLMDRKVDRKERRLVPLLVRTRAGEKRNRRGEEILWVVGHGVSESCRLSPGRRLLDLTWVSTT